MAKDDRPAVAPRMPGHLIRRLHQVSTRVFGQRLKAAGIDLTPIQFAALDALRAHPGIDQAGLAEAVAKDRATIGGVTDRLEQKGLVTRIVSERDRRARELTLSEAGRRILAAAEPVVTALQHEILPGLNEAEYAQFVALAAKAAAAAEEGDTTA
ncbi:MAG: MarR family winged helix-turn-helix transcriptional regulator [Pseudooceanicola nanhaiensis]|uniref:MarR family winged helix-turn-helix transcriptional regulator n=1 Tax=Pseudooceanicola nanhaiensis TaxID=375761 RepID=UPI00405A09B5